MESSAWQQSPCRRFHFLFKDSFCEPYHQVRPFIQYIMLSSDRNIETIGQLIVEVKRYVDLQVKSMHIGLVSKVSRLASALVLAGLIVCMVAVVFIFLSFTLASVLGAWVGQSLGYLMVALLYLLLAFIVYIKRKSWIETPITRLIVSILLSDDDSTSSDSED